MTVKMVSTPTMPITTFSNWMVPLFIMLQNNPFVVFSFRFSITACKVTIKREENQIYLSFFEC